MSKPIITPATVEIAILYHSVPQTFRVRVRAAIIPIMTSLKKVNVGDALKADEMFTILMGEEVPPRKKFITSHAHLATLDI